MIPIVVFVLVAAATAQPPRPRIPAHLLAKATSSSSVPVSEMAIVTWMMQGPAEAPSELLFVVWRGQPGWYRGSPRSSSKGGSGNSFTSSDTYGTVRLDLDFDRSQRIATVQGTRVEMKDANVILVDAVDRPGATRITKTLRVAHIDRQPGPAGPVRALGASPEILEFIGCATQDAAAAGFCRYVVEQGKQD
jgi:hypothetical protein